MNRIVTTTALFAALLLNSCGNAGSNSPAANGATGAMDSIPQGGVVTAVHAEPEVDAGIVVGEKGAGGRGGRVDSGRAATDRQKEHK